MAMTRKDLTVDELTKWQEKMNKPGLTVGEAKPLAREFRDLYQLADMEALKLLRGILK